jgi:phosphatidylethanolamine/phosphatidyl-N-methylethanolamine N-methyltransferase
VSAKTQSFYNKFSFFYPLVDVFLRPQKRALFREINTLPQGNLLEIGVGNGAHLQLYKAHKVTGIDTSANMLAIAAKRKASNVELLQMNGESLDFADDYFDYVVLSHVIAVVDNPEKLLSEAFRVLKPDGRIFILNHFTPNNWLKFIDRSFNFVSRKLHFKSVFYIDDLSALRRFSLLKEISFGSLSYFKLLIYQKK